MPNDDLYSLLQGMDPKTLQAMIDAGLYDERMTPLKQRFGIGNEMLQTPMAQGRQVGNTYVASSPLEHLSNAIRQIVGARQAQQAMAGEDKQATIRGKGRLGMLNAIANQRAYQPGSDDDTGGYQ